MSNGNNNKSKSRSKKSVPKQAPPPKAAKRRQKNPKRTFAIGERDGAKQVMKILQKSGPTYGLAANDFTKWARLLARPFDEPLVKCPVNFNPVPSLLTFSATTASTGSFVVDANSSVELVCFPGHSDESNTDPMDGEAYHSQMVTCANGASVPGPVDAAAGNLAFGLMISRSHLLQDLPQPNGDYNAVYWDNPLPMKQNFTAGHLRYKLVAMGLKWKNNTALLNQGGNVKSVQPPIAFQPATGPGLGWHQFDRFPSYKLYIGLNGQVSWIPRLEDESYWHTTSIGSMDNSNAGLRVLFSSDDVRQSYEYEIVCHWELAGSSVTALSTEAKVSAQLRGVVEDGVNRMANSSHTAAGAVQMFSDAVDFGKKAMSIASKVAEHIPNKS